MKKHLRLKQLVLDTIIFGIGTKTALQDLPLVEIKFTLVTATVGSIQYMKF